MKKITFFSTFVLMTALSFSQAKKGSFIISEGFHKCENANSFVNMNPNGWCPTGEITREGITQKGGTFFDAAVLYKQPLKIYSTSLLFGLGANQKGFTEKGTYTLWGETTRQGYTTERKITYAAISAGVSFEVIRFRKVSVSLAGLISPEIRVHSSMSDADKSQFKVLAFSIRSFMDVEYKWRDNLGLHLMPFFQGAISNYNRSLESYELPVNTTNPSYCPYSIGLSAGISF